MNDIIVILILAVLVFLISKFAIVKSTAHTINSDNVNNYDNLTTRFSNSINYIISKWD